MNKGCKRTLIVISIIFATILICGYFTLKTFGEAFGEECDKTENWTIKEYRIQEYSCLGWAGPRYYPLYLFKNGKELPSTGYRTDSCLISFNPKKDLHLKFDICENRIERFEPNKKNIRLGSTDSIRMFSKTLNKSKKLTSEKIKLFEKQWKLSKPRGFREDIDSVFYPDFQYKISVFKNGKEKEFLTFKYLINDRTNWVYTLEDEQDNAFFEELWNE
jgi:hypothetical protein